MDLRSYKRAFRRTYRSVAQAVGVSQATISYIVSGQHRPSQRLADAIEAATDGHVRAADLRALPQRRGRRAAAAPVCPTCGSMLRDPSPSIAQPESSIEPRGDTAADADGIEATEQGDARSDRRADEGHSLSVDQGDGHTVSRGGVA
jgi:DNA-binding transcriptional regulator YdaS (Cro superfamily)